MDKFKSMSSQERIEFWKNALEAYHRSGKSPQEFCAEHEIGVSSLLSWKRRLKAGVSELGETVAIPVIRAGTQKRRAAAEQAVASLGSKLQIEVDGVIFQLSGSVDPSWVGALLISLQGGKGSC